VAHQNHHYGKIEQAYRLIESGTTSAAANLRVAQSSIVGVGS